MSLVTRVYFPEHDKVLGGHLNLDDHHGQFFGAAQATLAVERVLGVTVQLEVVHD